MSAFIDQHRNRTTAEGLKWGVEPICAVLPIAPATYYAAKTRMPSHRDVRDAWLTGEIHRVHTANYGVSTVPRRFGASSTAKASAWPAAVWNGSCARKDSVV
jgi:hypothetical protein